MSHFCSSNEVEEIVSQYFPFFNNSWQLNHSMSTYYIVIRVISFSIYLMPVLIMIQIVENGKRDLISCFQAWLKPCFLDIILNGRLSGRFLLMISAIWLILWHLWYSVLHKLGIISMIHTWNWYIIHSSIFLAQESSFQVRLSEVQTRFSNIRDRHLRMSCHYIIIF